MQIKSNTFKITLCAIFAALSAVLSQISIPIGLVPITLTHVSIFLAAGLLGKKYGTISQIVFVLIGAMGVPVFSGFRGGLGVLFGPTGGYILGYVFCAFITGLIIERFGISIKTLIIAMYLGWIVTYVAGTPWYMISTGTDNVLSALTLCVFPYLPGDVFKNVFCVVLIRKLKPILNKRTA